LVGREGNEAEDGGIYGWFGTKEEERKKLGGRGQRRLV